jgi:plasmid stabilization system protein ParE
MSWPFQLTPGAIEDVDEIWSFIAMENEEAADRVKTEIESVCHHLTRYPMIGTRRPDITHLPVRFWIITKFPNYVIVYRPETIPLRVIAVLHGKRNLKEIMKERSR